MSGGPYRISDHLKELLSGGDIDIQYTANGKVYKKRISIDQTTGAPKNFGYLVSAALIGKAMSGDVAALREIADRVEGKAVSNVMINTQGNNVTFKIRGEADKKDIEIFGKSVDGL
jgi:hypothetical protein